MQQKTIDLRHVEILVLDEADRMLDMGFIHDIRRILGAAAGQAPEPAVLGDLPRRNPQARQLVHAAARRRSKSRRATRRPSWSPSACIPWTQARKRELLAHLVKTNNWQQVLVFTRTKHGANRLAQQLEREGIDADAIHGNKSQRARTRALKRFKDNGLQVLVATDIAARGLDIEELPHVVIYDLPHVAEDYVHRIGRTGRAGAAGEAVVLVSGEDRPLLAAIERLIGRRIEQRVVAGFEPGSRSSAPAQQHEPQRHERGRQGAGQSRHRNGGGNRQQQNNRQERRHEPRTPGQGPQQRHGQHKPQRPQHQQPAQSRQPSHGEQGDDRQPPPERAGNQLFPGLLGGLGRRMFGRKTS